MLARKSLRLFAALLTLGLVGNVIAVPAMAYDKKTKKPMSKMYECTHCKVKMSSANAKKHNMKCDCGMKLTEVKKGKKP